MKKNLIIFISALSFLTTTAFLEGRIKSGSKNLPEAGKSKSVKEIPVSPPPFSAGIFPCTECHDGSDINYRRRKLTEMHTNIVFTHDKENRWCLDCHSATRRDWLHLASGKLVSFKKSYILCGQCHGPKLKDWKLGIHGKRTGQWNGEKRYLLCVHCHNPHSPRFKKLKPMPPPVRQKDIR